MSQFAALVGFLGVSNPLFAAPSLDVAGDPRLDLVGVIQHLAGAPLSAPSAGLAAAVDDRFGPFRDHAAVRAYSGARQDARDRYGLLMLWLGDPPELPWARDSAEIPGRMLESLGGREAVEGIRSGLADFARRSDFMGFVAEHRPALSQSAADLRDLLGDLDPMRRLEDYLRVPLHARHTLIVPALYSVSGYCCFILPYPSGGASRPASPYSVYSIVDSQKVRSAKTARFAFTGGGSELNLWQEPSYLAIEPAFESHPADISRLRDLELALAGECPPSPGSCLKVLVVEALSSRLDGKTFGTLYRKYQTKGGRLYARSVRALTGRLVEFEKNPKRYPTFTDFLPRLLRALDPVPEVPK